MHDAHILRGYTLYRDATAKRDKLFPKKTFIVGDSAYPNTAWLAPQFRDTGHLDQEQRTFNCMHSSSRICAEIRFQRVLYFSRQENVKFVTNLIGCACVFHN